MGSKHIQPDTPSPSDPDAGLMIRFRDGDDDAFAEIVRRYQGRIVSLAFRYLGSAADAEDLAQEVFLRLYRARGSYVPTARFSTWIYRIAVNASLNHLRGRKVRRHLTAEMPTAPDGSQTPVFEDPDAPAPGARLEKSELAGILRDIVDGLPERQRVALLLNKYEELSYEDVAASMDLSVSAVKSLLTRARLNVKDKLLPYMQTGASPEEGSRP